MDLEWLIDSGIWKLIRQRRRPCYGVTVSGDRCQLDCGHYPDTPHYIGFPEGKFLAWTDEQMNDFQRIADKEE